jgi:serine/threonine protein kinase
MTSRWSRLESLYHEAAALPAALRARFLDDACQDDPVMRGEVEAMLAHEGTRFLDDPVVIAGASESVARGLRLAPGTTLGIYEVGALLGAGGMGEVYRARDTKLGRQVALKLLSASFTQDHDRVARFRREARVLATLNHPHIGTIYGLDEANGVQFLVLELIDGGTLADRIAKGPMSVDEAIGIARQIADALDAAHEKGIVHRDLKPANIAVTEDATVKVLDFGLAKATDPTSPSSSDLANSPTLPAATVQGVILGTAAYMSPEQAAGKAVDKRSDLWAFGVVLMEMLTGRQVFTGETVSHVLASILAKDPDWSTLSSTTPAPIRRLLRRCLEKDRKRRIADAADVRLEIDDWLAARPDEEPVLASSRRVRAWPYVAVAIVAAALGIAGTLAWPAADRAQPLPVYVSFDLPPDYVLGEDDQLVHLPTRTPIVFTPDGHSLVIQVARSGKPQLVMRSLDRPDARPIAGTEDARTPFISPDGKWIGFSTLTEIRKVPLEGGTPTTICPIGGNLGPIGAAWGARDMIIFGDPAGRIMRVSAGGGAPTPVTVNPALTHRHVAPSFLPDGVRFLFSDVSLLDVKDTRLIVQSVDGGGPRVVLTSATDGRLLPSGRLAFMRLGTLMTTAFDLARAEVVGDPIAALGGVMQSGLRVRAYANNTGAGMFAVSSRGDLAVIRGPVTGGEKNSMVWAIPNGQSVSAEPTFGAPAGGRLYTRIAPDRSRVAVTLITPTRFELWIADWKRNLWTQCGDCSGDSLRPFVWSPDGQRLLLPRFDRLVAHTLDGSAPDQVMARESDRRLEARAWLPDGRIVYESYSDSAAETKVLDVGAHVGRVVVQRGTGFDSEVSPDGRWLAYTTEQTGQPNSVVVQPFPGPGARTTVSASGGKNSLWSADGRTLYYLTRPPGTEETIVSAVGIRTAGDTFTAGTPRELLRTRDSICSGRCYEVSDGPRFLLREPDKASSGASVTRVDLILNWTATLPRNK